MGGVAARADPHSIHLRPSFVSCKQKTPVKPNTPQGACNDHVPYRVLQYVMLCCATTAACGGTGRYTKALPGHSTAWLHSSSSGDKKDAVHMYWHMTGSVECSTWFRFVLQHATVVVVNDSTSVRG